MRWAFGLLIFLLFTGCVSRQSEDYEKISLSTSTIEDIKDFLNDENPESAIQYLQALKTEGIEISDTTYLSLYQEAVALLKKQYEDAQSENNYIDALSKYRSLSNIGEIEYDVADEGELLISDARKKIEDDQVLSGLTILQRIIRQYTIPSDDLQFFMDTSIAEKNITAARQIRDELLHREEPVPEELTEFLSTKSEFAEMISGTVTIWVNRGITVEGGIGYPDRAIGSGFFIDKRGYLLTNYHVIYSEVDPEYEGFSRLYIKLSDDPETKIPAKVVGYDRIFDIALLKVEVKPDYVFSLSDERDFLPGEQLYAIGSPIGLENTITSGIVSAVGRRFLQIGDTIQVDVPVNSGNSGGPLIDKNGRLVGVIFAGIEQFEGINFAIPAYWIHLILPKLYEGSEVIHPWLGIAVKETDAGLEIIYVLPGEPADMAGLKQGDILQDFNGINYTDLKEIQHEIIKYQPETLVSLTWLRGDVEMAGYFSLSERPFRPMDIAIKRDTRENLVIPLFGVKLEETDDVFWRPNYTVRKVYKGSIADETGLSKDDPVSIQRWQIDEEIRIAILQLFVMKRTEGFLEKAVQLAAYLEIDTFI